MPVAGVSTAAVKPCARNALCVSSLGLKAVMTSCSGFIVVRPEPGPIVPGSRSFPGAPRNPGLPPAVAPTAAMFCVIVVETGLASVTCGSMKPA